MPFSICGLAIVCSGTPEGSEQTDPWLIRIAAFRLVGASSLQSSSLGIALVGLDEVAAEVIVTDSRDRPYTGNVEVVLTGGEFEKGVVNRVFAVKDGRLDLSFRPIGDEIPFLEISLRVPGAPWQGRYHPGKKLTVIVPGRVTATMHRRRAEPDGKDSLPVVVRVYDTKGRLMPFVPVELTYAPPELGAPQMRLPSRTGPDRAALVRLPPSCTAGLGMVQARLGTHYSNQVWVRFGPGPLPDEKEPARRSSSKKDGKGG